MEGINGRSGYTPEELERLREAEDKSYKKYPDGSQTMFDFTTPPQQDFDSEEMIGSMQRILADNIGVFVVIEFLIGTEMIMRKQGILYFVGTSYVTLYDDEVRNFIVCDIFSVKFVYFYLPGDRPQYNYNVLPAVEDSPRSQNNRRM